MRGHLGCAGEYSILLSAASRMYVRPSVAVLVGVQTGVDSASAKVRPHACVLTFLWILLADGARWPGAGCLTHETIC